MVLIKKWILVSLFSILFTLTLIAGFDYYIDPLWTFNHTSKFSTYQRGRKERQQKSNALYFRNKRYDTLIFGSSRTTYINQHHFNEHTFNYALSDMQPNEYEYYLDFAIYKAHQPVKNVIIGLDFFGALTYAPTISKDPEKILNRITEPFYRYKLLLSIDVLSYSFQNIKYYFLKREHTYTQDYVHRSPKKIDIDIESFNKKIDTKLYRRDRYSQKYDDNYLKILLRLVKRHPNIHFTVFTTPVSAKHFEAILQTGQYANYERWLQESVKAFGKVHHYMYLNAMTKPANLYFYDSNHMYNSAYDCIVYQLQNKPSHCPKVDMLITNDNIKESLQKLRVLNGVESKVNLK